MISKFLEPYFKQSKAQVPTRTAIIIIAQCNSFKLQTIISTFIIFYHISINTHIYRVATVFKFSNPAGLGLTYFSKGSYQDSRL